MPAPSHISNGNTLLSFASYYTNMAKIQYATFDIFTNGSSVGLQQHKFIKIDLSVRAAVQEVKTKQNKKQEKGKKEVSEISVSASSICAHLTCSSICNTATCLSPPPTVFHAI